MWCVRCICGNGKTVAAQSLRNGNTKSCGCWQREIAAEQGRKNLPRHITHGHSGSPTYRSWCSMRARCTNPNVDGYAYYGARGIKVCDRWQTFENFLADMGEKPVKGWHIDRIDSDGNYAPGNCRWVSPSENCREARIRQYHGGEVELSTNPKAVRQRERRRAARASA
jgi:hypothetical protein